MATFAQIRSAVEALKDTVGPVLVRRQNHYLVTYGRYWQGILTPSTPPDDLADATMDWTRRPSDQAESWAERFSGLDALPTTMKAQIRVDVYDGPLGKGWSVSLRFRKTGKIYERTWAFGPEARDDAWHEVTA